MQEIHCRHFNGYKPCGKSDVCSRGTCTSYQSVHERILMVHLGALGAVLRSTSLLAAIKRKYPRSHITWITKAPAHHLLQGLNSIDRVLTLDPEDLLSLSALHFDLAFVIDKSLVAEGLLRRCGADEVRGFRADASGAIVPANSQARELWEIGLSNQKKFFINTKTEQHLVHEALALGPYTRDEYQIALSTAEIQQVESRRRQWSPEGAPIIGINTGCSGVLPAKRLSVEGHRALISKILRDSRFAGCSLVLLGGPEDTERNELMAKGLPVTLSPTTRGLRDGLASVAACDLVMTGDSLGMHMAIGLKKWVVAWFGPSCAQEVDLYGRGEKVRTLAPCSPCWKRVCQQPVMCYDQVDFDHCMTALSEGLCWLTSSSKPHSREISSSPSL
ncbi:MAG: glycosyltransferase family 9 protein [Bdellovibrionales bacterium]